MDYQNIALPIFTGLNSRCQPQKDIPNMIRLHPILIPLTLLCVSCQNQRNPDIPKVPASAEAIKEYKEDSRFHDVAIIEESRLLAVIDSSKPEGVEIISMPRLDTTPVDARDSSIVARRILGGGHDKRVWLLEWIPGREGEKSFVRVPSRALGYGKEHRSLSFLIGNPNDRPIQLSLAAKVGPQFEYLEIRPEFLPPYARSETVTFSLDNSNWAGEASEWKHILPVPIEDIRELYLVVTHDSQDGALLIDQVGFDTSLLNQKILADAGMPREYPPRWADRHGRDLYGLWVDLMHSNQTIRFRWIPPGRNVDGFWFAETEITRAQYEAVTSKGSAIIDDLWREMPAQAINWHRSNHFCHLLTDFRMSLVARLPRTMEWLHAGLADATQGRVASDGDIEDMGWTIENAQGIVQPVARLAPNMWGLFDVHGNLAEWTSGQRGTGSQRWCYGGNINRSRARSRINSRWSAAAGNRFSRRGFRPLIEDPKEFRFGDQLLDGSVWLDHLQNGVWNIRESVMSARPRGMVSSFDLLPLIPSRPTVEATVSFGESEQPGPLILELRDADKQLFQAHIDALNGRATFQASVIPNRLEEIQADALPETLGAENLRIKLSVESDHIHLYINDMPILQESLGLSLPIRFRVLNGAQQPIEISGMRILPTM